MTLRIGINGLGRIGRGLVRRLSQLEGFELAVINDTAPAEEIAYLLKYDSIYGTFDAVGSVKKMHIKIKDWNVPFHHADRPDALKWGDFDCDFVVDATGKFKSRDDLSGYLRNGARKVMVSGPAYEVDRMVVYGVNHQKLKKDDRLISNASCTTNCLAPLLKVLNEAYGIDTAMATTVHTYTNSQSLLDAPMGTLRRNRAGALSMIPTTTSAALATVHVLPELRGKITAMSIRVPVASVSLVDLVAVLKNPPSDSSELNRTFETAALGPYKDILSTEADELVSCDFRQSPFSATVDLPSTTLCRNQAKIIAWYDNEWGYICRLIDVMAYTHNLSN